MQYCTPAVRLTSVISLVCVSAFKTGRRRRKTAAKSLNSLLAELAKPRADSYTGGGLLPLRPQDELGLSSPSRSGDYAILPLISAQRPSVISLLESGAPVDQIPYPRHTPGPLHGIRITQRPSGAALRRTLCTLTVIGTLGIGAQWNRARRINHGGDQLRSPTPSSPLRLSRFHLIDAYFSAAVLMQLRGEIWPDGAKSPRLWQFLLFLFRCSSRCNCLNCRCLAGGLWGSLSFLWAHSSP